MASCPILVPFISNRNHLRSILIIGVWSKPRRLRLTYFLSVICVCNCFKQNWGWLSGFWISFLDLDRFFFDTLIINIHFLNLLLMIILFSAYRQISHFFHFLSFGLHVHFFDLFSNLLVDFLLKLLNFLLIERWVTVGILIIVATCEMNNFHWVNCRLSQLIFLSQLSIHCIVSELTVISWSRSVLSYLPLINQFAFLRKPAIVKLCHLIRIINNCLNDLVVSVVRVLTGRLLNIALGWSFCIIFWCSFTICAMFIFFPLLFPYQLGNWT